jgi:hypothetical protein
MLARSQSSAAGRAGLALAVAAHAALLVGVSVTALLHSAVGPTVQPGQSGALQWTSTYSVNNVAPLVAAATGLAAGRRTGVAAAAGSFAGNAAGYLVLSLGAYAVNAAALGVAQAGVLVDVYVATATGVGATGALFAVVGARWA